MSTWVTIRSVNRSQNVRVAGNKLTPSSSVRVDLDDPKTRRDFQQHSAIGAITVVPGGSTSQTAVVWTGGTGVAGAGLAVNTNPGELRNNVTDTYLTFPTSGGTNLALATAPTAGNSRLDLVQVNYTTGAVTAVTGVVAPTGSQVASSAAAGNLPLYTVLVGPSATIPGTITDVRPRF